MLDFARDASRFPLLGISRLHSQNNSMLSSNRIQRDGILIGPYPRGLFSIFYVMQKFATSMMQVLVGPRLLLVSRNCRATPRPLSSCSLFPKLMNPLLRSNQIQHFPYGSATRNNHAVENKAQDNSSHAPRVNTDS
jgi:hypothetical protein